MSNPPHRRDHAPNGFAMTGARMDWVMMMLAAVIGTRRRGDRFDWVEAEGGRALIRVAIILGLIGVLACCLPGR
jgi:hypothetical protein